MALTETPPLAPGLCAPGFRLPATDGRTLSLADVRGPRGVVVMFICNHCPYVQAIRERLIQDAADLIGAGVGVVGISSNDAGAYPEDSFERMREISLSWRLPFPYLYDADQSVARAYGAVCTPDFFGFDAEGLLRYRGRLDAAHRGPRPDGMARELVDAMLAVADGRALPVEQHPSMGCSIKWKHR